MLKKYALAPAALQRLHGGAPRKSPAFPASWSCLCYGAYRVMYGHATVGDFVMFAGYQAMLLGPLDFFSNLYTQLSVSAAAADRTFEFFDTDARH